MPSVLVLNHISHFSETSMGYGSICTLCSVVDQGEPIPSCMPWKTKFCLYHLYDTCYFKQLTKFRLLENLFSHREYPKLSPLARVATQMMALAHQCSSHEFSFSAFLRTVLSEAPWLCPRIICSFFSLLHWSFYFSH